MKQEGTLTAEERKRLDRQRFIGLQTQKKLINTRVLITPANGPNTELAKNLVLAGVNVTIFDDAIVSDSDFETNFLIAKSCIGSSRGLAIYNRLKDMNPSGKNEFYNENLNANLDKHGEQFFKKFGIVATSFTNFVDVSKWDILTKKFNIPYYNSVCAGLHAFVYISLGNKFAFKEVNAQKATEKTTKIDVLPLSTCLNPGQLKNSREYGCIAAIMMMNRAQEKNLKYDPFDESNEKANQKTLSEIVQIGEAIRKSPKDNEMLTDFARCFGIDYCPVYSVIGSIISQEVIKVVENKHEPAMNWLVYNSDQGFATVVKLSQQTKLMSFEEIDLNV